MMGSPAEGRNTPRAICDVHVMVSTSAPRGGDHDARCVVRSRERRPVGNHLYAGPAGAGPPPAMQRISSTFTLREVGARVADVAISAVLGAWTTPTVRPRSKRGRAMTVMKISQTLALIFVVACTSATVAPRAQASPDVRVFQNPDQSEITEGETVLATDPDTAYRVLTDYARWPTMFPDIKRVIITSQQGGHDRVPFIHTEGNRDNVHFHNRPEARLVWFEDTGGRAEVWFEILFMPGMQPGTTRVHSRLYAG